jgi:FkbM family methyltransferase
MTARASVVIPVHNAGSTLGRQLRALVDQVEAPEFDVAVVLNRCSDNSREVAESFQGHLELQVVVANGKASAAYARNIGAFVSEAPCILFCDADDMVGVTWVRLMTKALEEGDADFVGGCPIVDRSQLSAWVYRRYYEGVDGPHLGRLAPGTLYPMGASLGVSRPAFEEVEGFDESFPGAGFEEVDFARRLLSRGRRVGLVSDATFTYQPRQGLVAEMRRQRGFARGAARLAMKEHRPLERRNVARQLTRIARTMVDAVKDEHVFGPSELVARGLESWFVLSAARASATAPGAAERAELTEDFVAPLDTPQIGGLAFASRPDTARIYVDLVFEQVSIALLDFLLKPGDRMVDCGANIGVFSIAAALKVGSAGRVVAFEPDQRTRVLLTENAIRHRVQGILDIRPEGVGAEPIRLSFRMYDNDLLSGFVDTHPHYSGGLIKTVETTVVSLDLAVEGPVNLIKIDVEGLELDVLAGAGKLLDNSPNAALIIECNPDTLRAAGADPRDLLRLLDSKRWSVWLVDDRHTGPHAVRRLDQEARRFVLSSRDAWYGNLAVVPQQRDVEMQRFVSQFEDSRSTPRHRGRL